MKAPQNQLALITGASSGIGFELAKIFAQNGYDLVVCSHGEGIHRAAREFKKLGVKVKAVQADLSKPAGIDFLWKSAKSLKRPIDAVAINAGIGVGGDFARETDLATELELIDLNVRGTVHLAKLAVDDMLEHGKGKILFTSSIAAMMAGSFEAVYSASKAFIQNFSQAIREELSDTRITVTALQPGPTETNFFARAGMLDTAVGAGEKDDPALVARQGFDALMAGKDYVIAGSVKNQVMAMAGKLLPEVVVAKLHRRLSEPGTAKKSA